MAKKEFLYKGKTLEELQKLSTKELATVLPAPARRKINRGFTEAEKLFLKSLKTSKKPVKTHCRDMIVLPTMVEKTIRVYTGKSFEDVIIQPEMIGHRLGEFALSRKKAAHTVSGVGSKKKGKVR